MRSGGGWRHRDAQMADTGARRVRTSDSARCGASGAARRRDIGDGRTTVRTGWRTTHRSALYGPGGEPEIPSENSPHPSVLVGGVRRLFGGDFGLHPPGPYYIVRPTDMGGAPPGTVVRPSVAYVTPSRRATRTALSNSSSARACHLDVATLRRFSPATGGGGGTEAGTKS